MDVYVSSSSAERMGVYEGEISQPRGPKSSVAGGLVGALRTRLPRPQTNRPGPTHYIDGVHRRIPIVR